MIFKGMLSHDVQLRLGGTYTKVLFSDGTSDVVYIREVITTNDTRGYSTGCDLRLLTVITEEGSREYSADVVQDIMFDAPPSGYVLYDGLRYVSQLPERQTKAGAPPHSIRIQRLGGRSFRLGDHDAKDAIQIVRSLLNPVYRLPVWDGSAGRYFVLDKGLAVDTQDRVIYGPEFFVLGKYTVRDGEVEVKTKHPVALRTYLMSAGVLK